jgi:choline transport protein
MVWYFCIFSYKHIFGWPITDLYRSVIIARISVGVGITLSELASASPNSGDQNYWTIILPPKRYARFWAYLCGALAWAGAVFTTSSVTLSIASAVVGMYTLNRQDPNSQFSSWQVFMIYQIVNTLAFFFNCSNQFLPYISLPSFYMSLFSFLILVTCSRGH